MQKFDSISAYVKTDREFEAQGLPRPLWSSPNRTSTPVNLRVRSTWIPSRKAIFQTTVWDSLLSTYSAGL